VPAETSAVVDPSIMSSKEQRPCLCIIYRMHDVIKIHEHRSTKIMLYINKF